ncbi:FAD-dependent oxidoreductase [Streptomyces sp. NPDC102476]|uniref:NAD(P)-binding protein n=1 Tax=Streptomyces sp. NPDC102476 TaxID=3366181 RepID=UPI00381723A5
MTHVLVLGAGPTGLTTAMLLAADGHRVTVVERNPDEPHGDAARLWEGWERRGGEAVPHAAHGHASLAEGDGA